MSCLQESIEQNKKYEKEMFPLLTFSGKCVKLKTNGWFVFL